MKLMVENNGASNILLIAARRDLSDRQKLAAIRQQALLLCGYFDQLQEGHNKGEQVWWHDARVPQSMRGMW